MERTENLGSAFLHKGHSKTTDPHIGIFSQNRPEVRTQISVLMGFFLAKLFNLSIYHHINVTSVTFNVLMCHCACVLVDHL